MGAGLEAVCFVILGDFSLFPAAGKSSFLQQEQSACADPTEGVRLPFSGDGRLRFSRSRACPEGGHLFPAQGCSIYRCCSTVWCNTELCRVSAVCVTHCSTAGGENMET